MRKIERLRKEALESCKFRGHRMELFNRLCLHWWSSKCKDCGMTVQVNDAPDANEIEIGGEAVALHCRATDSKKT